jgi:hypothetical protein
MDPMALTQGLLTSEPPGRRAEVMREGRETAGSGKSKVPRKQCAPYAIG